MTWPKFERFVFEGPGDDYRALLLFWPWMLSTLAFVPMETIRRAYLKGQAKRARIQEREDDIIATKNHEKLNDYWESTSAERLGHE